MAPTLQITLLLTVALYASAAPQAPTVPYDFSYGVNIVETGDVKEHKETKSPGGRTDGEYRWLQPNGLYRVVRYYVEPGSGFVAQVSEEPGPDVPNYYTNSLAGDNGNSALVFPEGRSLEGLTPTGRELNSDARSLESSSQLNSISRLPNTISRQPLRKPVVPSPTPAAFVTPRPDFVRPSSFIREQSFNSQQSSSNQQSFSSQENFVGEIIDGGIIDGGIIDGGVIDGGIIDGGIIDGGIIDGGIINGAFVNGQFVPSFGNRSK
ncbi:unnamed protein product [Meganyctiphanes norvegica]|uniref:Cuticle protein n=1 Tax=Meganyctiphanes norvegica TaxID=48144 RepID=A0AAV2RHX6_MEGNR